MKNIWMPKSVKFINNPINFFRMKRCDAVIVGAGAAGLGVAAHLRNSGLNIIILEKKKSLDKQATNLKATFGSAVKEFKLESAVLRKYKKTTLYGPNSKAHVDLSSEPAYLVDYIKILKLLKRRSGLKINFNVEVIGAEKTNDGIILKDTKDNKYFAKLVVDASGRSSSIAQMMGIERANNYCKFYGFEMEKCNIDPSEGVFYVDRRFTKAGGWVYPISKTRCQVAIGEFLPLEQSTGPDLRRNLLRFIKEYKHYNLRKAKIVKCTTFSVQYPISPVIPMVKDRLIVIGDAAGHATPIMAEGIRPILKMSVAAAARIKECFKCKNFSQSFLADYEDRWWDMFGKNYYWGVILRHVSINYFDNKQWDIVFKKLDSLDIKTKYNLLKSNFSFSMLRNLITPTQFLRVVAIFMKEKSKRAYIISRRRMVSDFV